MLDGSSKTDPLTLAFSPAPRRGPVNTGWISKVETGVDGGKRTGGRQQEKSGAHKVSYWSMKFDGEGRRGMEEP